MKDILLIPIVLLFNCMSAYIGFIVLTVCNQILIGMNFNETDFDQLIGNMTFKSFESLMFIFFLYFFGVDLKTLLTRKLNQVQEYECLEKYGSKGKLLLNQAFNIFKKVPFENSLKQSIKIYPLRIFLVIIVMLPLYIFQLFLFLFSIAPVSNSLLVLTILLGATLLYQFDTNVGKNIEKYFLNYPNWVKPDKLQTCKRNAAHKIGF